MQFARATMLLVALTASLPATAAKALKVFAISPPARSTAVPVDAAIEVRFAAPIESSTLTAESFWAFGRWSGTVRGTITLTNGARTATLTPERPFSAGELVTVYLANSIRAAGGESVRAGGYSIQFWAAAAVAPLAFVESDRFSTRTTVSSTRSYGGFASDLDGDGWLDLSIVNEDSSDVRVFMNSADGSGRFGPALLAATTGAVPSPSEPSDFNRDGLVDVAVANLQGESVTILTGVGDGTFVRHQDIPVSGTPRGIAVLDFDGDGDTDVAVTARSSGRVHLLRNDDGVFTSMEPFGTGTDGEWGLVAGDMDNDGRLDLVASSRDARRYYVYLARGEGDFELSASGDIGGNSWMLALGDVDGDGNEDLVSANSIANNGSVLYGDGRGGLSAPVTFAVDPFPLATDLGDLDGDGDLDWVLSSFDGDWSLLRNDGGTFALDQEFPAPAAASCALLLDVDNDRTLDLALIDELADVVIVMRHPPVAAKRTAADPRRR